MIPTISHLQYLVLNYLTSGEQPCKTLKEYLTKNDHVNNGPAFYRMLLRMEDDKLIRGEYRNSNAKFTTKERWYIITDKGYGAVKEVKNFYGVADNDTASV